MKEVYRRLLSLFSVPSVPQSAIRNPQCRYTIGMSEILVKNPPNALTVSHVEPGSAADRAGIEPGDLLREMNGKPMLDILDYQFHSTEDRLACVVEREERLLNLVIRKRNDEDTGLMFATDLGDKIHTCNNKCVFCFIHQMPRGERRMRRTLYLMDDDFRLSFMHGNYVTLTNVSDAEFERIIEQKLSPLYVSVHATDPELRGILLGKKGPAPILPQIRRLADNRIGVHAQIVLCPGLNDGAALMRTLDELAAEHVTQTGKRAGVESVAIVPVGLTRFRERLPDLTMANRDYAREMIRTIDAREKEFRKRLATRFAWLSDEWYFLADLSIPGTAHYEEFPQLEDGIGTVRLFLDNAKSLESRLPSRAKQPVKATLVTAELPSGVVRGLADRLNRIEGVELNVCVVKNEFFGGGINIAGLLTAQDILAQLNRFPAHETVYIPSICLRDDTLFLDDRTLDDVREETGRDLRVVGTRPRDLATALGLLPPERKRHFASHWLSEGEAA
jgi:putative radical SAM enzyme (TIGR03279 family)